MGAPSSQDTRQLLDRMGAGDAGAADELYVHIHGELRRIASRLLSHERADHTLQPTALVNEAWLRLSGGAPLRPSDRSHFVRLAARAMRRVLVDHARRRHAGKRQGDRRRCHLPEVPDRLGMDPGALLSLDEALERLGQRDEQVLRVVELRYFSGLTLAETGALVGLSERQAWLAWSFARGWLKRDLERGQGTS